MSLIVDATVDVDDWCGLVRAEFLEMPGLHLTAAQAERLWQFDPGTCRAVLDRLVNSGFLRQTRGTYALRALPVVHT